MQTILRYVTRDSLTQPHPIWHRDPECASGENLAVLDSLAGKFAQPCRVCAEDRPGIEFYLTDDSNLRLVDPFEA